MFAFFADLKDSFYRLSGIRQSTIPRDIAYDFMQLGIMLERTEDVSRMLDVKYHFLLPRLEDVGGSLDILQWAAVLRSASGLEAYRKRFGNSIRIDNVVEILLFDPTFPRSARFALAMLETSLRRIQSQAPEPSPSHSQLEELLALMQSKRSLEVIKSGLHQFLIHDSGWMRRAWATRSFNATSGSIELKRCCCGSLTPPASSTRCRPTIRTTRCGCGRWKAQINDASNLTWISLPTRVHLRIRRLLRQSRLRIFDSRSSIPCWSSSANSLVERIAAPQPPAIPMPFGEYLLEDHVRNRVEYDFLNASRHVPFSEPMRKFFWLAKPDPSEDVAAYANRVVAFIRDQFVYEPGMTKVQSTADEILSVGGGVCQDFAHLTIGVLRLAGIPARYVSGYLAPSRKGGYGDDRRTSQSRMARSSTSRARLDRLRSHQRMHGGRAPHKSRCRPRLLRRTTYARRV